MPFFFSRSRKFGPFRINLSRRGVGVSVGVPGARVSIGPAGTHVSFGAGGFRYRKRIDGRSRGTSSQDPVVPPAASDASPHGLNHSDPTGLILTANASTLAEVAPDQIIADLQGRLSRPSHFTTFVAAAGILAFLLFAMLPPLGVAAVVLLAIAAFPVYRWDRERRSAQLVYDLQDPEVQHRFEIVSRAGQALASASTLWHVHHSLETDDWKRNAGAKTLVGRTPTRAMVGTLPGIEINIAPWAIPIGPQQLLFLPDRLLIWDGRVIAGVDYGQLMSEAIVSQFIEDEDVPPDAHVVGATWQYVNKNGGPDRRYSVNPQLSIVLYGTLHLSTYSGLHVFLQTSTVRAAQYAVEALQALSHRVRSMELPPSIMVSPGITPAQNLAPPAESSPVARPPETRAVLAQRECSETSLAIMVLSRYLATADRRLDSSEVAFAHQVYKSLTGVTDDDPAIFSNWFRQLAADRSRVDAALEVLSLADLDLQRWALDVLERMTLSDGKCTPKEAEVLAGFRSALGQAD